MKAVLTCLHIKPSRALSSVKVELTGINAALKYRGKPYPGNLVQVLAMAMQKILTVLTLIFKILSELKNTS